MFCNPSFRAAINKKKCICLFSHLTGVAATSKLILYKKVYSLFLNKAKVISALNRDWRRRYCVNGRSAAGMPKQRSEEGSCKRVTKWQFSEIGKSLIVYCKLKAIISEKTAVYYRKLKKLANHM